MHRTALTSLQMCYGPSSGAQLQEPERDRWPTDDFREVGIVRLRMQQESGGLHQTTQDLLTVNMFIEDNPAKMFQNLRLSYILFKSLPAKSFFNNAPAC